MKAVDWGRGLLSTRGFTSSLRPCGPPCLATCLPRGWCHRSLPSIRPLYKPPAGLFRLVRLFCHYFSPDHPPSISSTQPCGEATLTLTAIRSPPPDTVMHLKFNWIETGGIVTIKNLKFSALQPHSALPGKLRTQHWPLLRCSSGPPPLRAPRMKKPVLLKPHEHPAGPG